MIGWGLFILAVLLETYLFAISLKRERVIGLSYLHFVSGYCVVAGVVIALVAITDVVAANILNNWATLGQDALFGLLCLEIMYALRPEQRTPIGVMLEISQWLLLLCFTFYWFAPHFTTSVSKYFSLVADSALLLCIWRAPIVPHKIFYFGGESHRFIALAVGVMFGLQSLCSILKITNMLAQICWILGLLCIITSVLTFSNGTNETLCSQSGQA